MYEQSRDSKGNRLVDDLPCECVQVAVTTRKNIESIIAQYSAYDLACSVLFGHYWKQTRETCVNSS